MERRSARLYPIFHSSFSNLAVWDSGETVCNSNLSFNGLSVSDRLTSYRFTVKK